MIKLQDLIKEANEVENNALENELKDAFKELSDELQNVDTSDIQDVEDKEITEAFTMMTGLAIMLSGPKIIELFSKLINRITKLITRQRVEKTKMTEWLMVRAEKWEHAYIYLIKKSLKGSGIAKRAGVKTDADLDKMAKITYFSILGVVAISSGISSAEAYVEALAAAKKAGLGALKSSLAGIKVSEIYQGIKQMRSKTK